MCLAKDFSEKLINVFTEIETAYNQQQESLRRIEQVQQDLLHAIENNNFNACEGYKLAKMLSDTRKERRLIKNELETLEQLKANFSDESKQSLSAIYEAIVHRNQILKDRLETKKYVPRASAVTVGNNDVETLPVVKNKKPICIDGKYKKTKEPITIMMKVDDDLYYVKFKKNNARCLMRKTSIIDADLSKIS